MKVLFLSLAIILSLNKPASAMDEGWSTQAIVATAIGSGGLVAACCGMCVACCSGYGFSCFDSCKDYMASYGIGFFQNTGLGRINQTLESGFNRLAQNKDEIKKIKDELKNLRIEVSSLSNDYSRKNNTIEDLCDNNTNVAERS
jgi:septal ring factor EnvC (AmiA/AmiB activator)